MICISCGRPHGMVLENKETGEATSIDWCKDCLFSKGYTYKEPDPIDLECGIRRWKEMLEETQKKIIEDMIGMQEVCSEEI